MAQGREEGYGGRERRKDQTGKLGKLEARRIREEEVRAGRRGRGVWRKGDRKLQLQAQTAGLM